MHTATHRHERTPERESINRTPNLHEAAGFEERGRFRPDDVAPSAFSGAFPELRRELNLYRLFGCHMLNLLGARRSFNRQVVETGGRDHTAARRLLWRPGHSLCANDI